MIAPKLRNATWAYREMLEAQVRPSTRWLDLGCGHQLLPSWMPDGEAFSSDLARRCRALVGIDRVHDALRRHSTLKHRLAADVGGLPFRDAAFDLVTANMVVEHVDDPRALLREIARVLTPGGVFLFHTPNRLGYQVLPALIVAPSLRRRAAVLLEGRSADDVFLTRYLMNSRRDVHDYSQQCGFIVDEIVMLNSSLMTSRLGPLAVPELLLARLLESDRLEGARTNMIAVLRKH
jgi:SAM-dependent methyltransferase